jgi:hypothetical protein
MGPVRIIATFALRQLVGDSADAVIGVLTDIFSDRSRRLLQAIQTSTDRAWRSLEIALAGTFEALGQKLRASGDEKAFAQEVRKFLEAFPPG